MDNIFDYLLDLLMDSYELYLTYSQDYEWNNNRNNLSSDEKAFNNKLVFSLNADIICNEQVLDAFYDNLISLENELAFSLEQIVAFLASRYTMFCYDDKTQELNYLNNSSLEEVLERFKEDYDFAIEIIDKAFKSFLNKVKINHNIALSLANNDSYLINKWLYNENDEIEANLNEELRDSICNMIDKMVQTGIKYHDALEYAWQFFTRNFDPTGIIEKYGDERNPGHIKQEILNIMYSDVFEDACNRHNIDELDYDDRFMMITVILAVYSGIIRVPSEQIRKEFMARFIDLRYDYEKRKKNRCASYESGAIQLVKKVNPSYSYDELTF